MNIRRIDLIHIDIPLKRPFETSFGVIAKRPALIIKMTTGEGLIGYGESSPLYVPMSEPETIADGKDVLKRVLPGLIGLSVEQGTDVTERYKDMRHPVSTIGIEAAYQDLVAKAKNIQLRTLFGGTRDEVIAEESVGIQPTAGDVINEIRKYVTAGFRRIKIKIAPGKDIDVVKAVRLEFPELAFGLDANAAYTASDLGLLASLGDFHPAFIEQPFGPDDYGSHAKLQSLGITVCLDETIRDFETCKRVVDLGACGIINIKPARIGSFKESKLIHDHCVASGIRLFGGGRLETGIGKTANANFYSLPGFTDASDLTPPQEYFEDDIIDVPFSIQRDVCKLPSGAGIGVGVNEEILQKFLRDRSIFE